ncbi:MAG: MFS transporter [Pseudomonadales bacterium]
MTDAVGYRRERKRQGGVPLSTRIYQGVGALPDTFKDFAVKTFLLIYYNQVLGLPASWVSAALALALFVDAVTDPIVGSWSDNFRSRLGRRHPFMYAAALPLGLCLYLLFAPPALDDALLLAWLLFFIVATRVCMTFYLIPWNSLFAEFSDDYQERSAIVTYRFLMGWIGGISFTFAVYSWVFPSSTDYPFGQLNPESYAHFAAVLALSVVAAVLFTTHMTRDQIPFLMQPQGEVRPFGLRQVLREVLTALRNRDFLLLFLAVLASSLVIGTHGALEIYMRTYFWGLDTGALRWFALGFTGALLAFLTILPLQSRFDKKHILVATSVLYALAGMALVSLRLLDLLPANGDPLLLWLLIGDAIVRTYLGTIAVIMFISMVADTLDAQELRTGLRQEGVFSSVLAFSGKATSGLGLLIAGLLLDAVVHFPERAAATAVPADVLLRLGVIDGLVVPLFNLIWMVLVLRYRITRPVHEQMRRELDARRAADG